MFSFEQKQKWYTSVVAGILFMLLSNRTAYGITNPLAVQVTGSTLISPLGSPTLYGIAVHSVVFGLLFYFLLRKNRPQFVDKLNIPLSTVDASHAALATVTFALLSSPEAYRTAGKLATSLGSPFGAPRATGVVIHGLIFTLLNRALLEVKTRDLELL